MIPQIHKELMRYGLHDMVRLAYARLLWKKPENRERLLRHWNDPRHPYSDRFPTHRADVERILTADPTQDDGLNQELDTEGKSLRTVIREIPPVFDWFSPTTEPEIVRDKNGKELLRFVKIDDTTEVVLVDGEEMFRIVEVDDDGCSSHFLGILSLKSSV